MASHSASVMTGMSTACRVIGKAQLPAKSVVYLVLSGWSPCCIGKLWPHQTTSVLLMTSLYVTQFNHQKMAEIMTMTMTNSLRGCVFWEPSRECGCKGASISDHSPRDLCCEVIDIGQNQHGFVVRKLYKNVICFYLYFLKGFYIILQFYSGVHSASWIGNNRMNTYVNIQHNILPLNLDNIYRDFGIHYCWCGYSNDYWFLNFRRHSMLSGSDLSVDCNESDDILTKMANYE